MRVIAIESMKNGILRTYGEGKYLGDKIPNTEPFISANIKNPCILLDNGKYIWGFQCWWSSIEEFNEKNKSSVMDKIHVDVIDDIKPLKVETNK